MAEQWSSGVAEPDQKKRPGCTRLHWKRVLVQDCKLTVSHTHTHRQASCMRTRSSLTYVHHIHNHTHLLLKFVSGRLLIVCIGIGILTVAVVHAVRSGGRNRSIQTGSRQSFDQARGILNRAESREDGGGGGGFKGTHQTD